MLGGERLELRDERELAAERELRIDPLLDRRQPQLLESLDLDPRERLELEIGERPAMPQPLRRAQQLRGRGRVADRERLASRRDEPLEVLEVELARLDAEQVAGSARDEPRLVRAGGASTFRRRETWLRSAWSAELRLCSAKSSPISRSRGTTRFALSSSSASSARCFGPPTGTGLPSTRTASGPRIRNSRRPLPSAPPSPPPPGLRYQGPGRRWDSFGTRWRDDRPMLYTAKCFWPGVTEDELRLAAARAGGETGDGRRRFSGERSTSPATSSCSACSTPRRARR